MFIKSNNEITYSSSNILALEELPAGNWLLKFNPIKGHYLEQTSDFKFPSKIYGDAEKLAKRYLNTFNKSDGNLGVLLTGTKGTGKSVTAKLTASVSNLAVVIITEPFYDDDFKSFLSNIKQKCVVLIDEFEKVYYNQELQNNLLSILDGVFESEKLFIFTSNEKHSINEYMINRPGRIHYLGEYDTLSDSIIEDVIDDNLIIKNHKSELLEVLNILGIVTMDVLISLIGEMNMYEENAKKAISYLNLKPDSNFYNVEVYQGSNRLGSTVLHYHPLMYEDFSIEFLSSNISNYINDSTKGDSERDVVVKDGLSLNNDDSGWLYLDINITTSKVMIRGKKIIIESDNNMRYIFSKKKSYTYTF